MKQIILTSILVLCISGINAQCYSNGYSKPTQVSAGLFLQKSAQNFGIGIHAGIIADHVAVFAGFIEYKYLAAPGGDRTGAITIAAPYYLFNEKLLVMPHFSAGLHNYQDIGMSIGYDIPDYGTFNLHYSRTMRFGLSYVMRITNR